ncbi:MAG: LacI family DNA-binding transcriptional regulator [Caulobacteraceae bacterium]|nr:LacI family DNA-binding transcriptional regulator [Caulobacteraceae bacterium]
MVATIKDVASRAEVSVMTVSRVLNGGDHVSLEKRERVLAAVSALGYRRNQSARGLPGSRTYVLALIAAEAPSYVAEIERGAIRQCRRDDYHLAVVSPDPAIEDPVEAMRALIATLRADGLILLPPLANHAGVLDLLDKAGLAYVRIGPDDRSDRAPSVGMDETAAADELTSHLLDLGHRRIGFIGGPPDQGGALRRYRGYARALERRGIKVEPELVRPGDFTFAGGLAAARDLLTMDHRPSAIFASNDPMALGVMSAASQAGLSVPEEIAVAGFDDGEAARRTWPRLTTIRQPTVDLGEAAAELLIARAGRAGALAPVQARVLDYELIIRGSTRAGADG